MIGAIGVDKPFVLIGHSISGLYLRSYARQYTSDLAALVFIDGATPLQDVRVPKSLVAIQDDQRARMPWQKFLMTVGWYRLHGDCSSVPVDFEAYSAIIQANNCDPAQFDALEAELDAVRRSGEETRHVGPFPSLPILILSRDPASMPSNWPADVAKANSLVWDQMQEESKQLSPLSRRIIAKGSDHYIHVDRPELVVREVTSLVEALRQGKVAIRRTSRLSRNEERRTWRRRISSSAERFRSRPAGPCSAAGAIGCCCHAQAPRRGCRSYRHPTAGTLRWVPRAA